jgi:predicted dithiol-disulfide oxidoreductase (DUF899 family)
MTSETIERTFRQTNLPNEPAGDLAKREELRLAEIELMKQKERVSGPRRRLSPGPPLKDYEFKEGSRSLTVHLSEPFSAPNWALIIYRMILAAPIQTWSPK